MTDPREVADRLHRLDAMRARLAPFAPIVRNFERDGDELAQVRKSRKGRKAEREERAKVIAARMNDAWPLVERVAQSRLLIKKLYDQVLESEGAQFDFERAAHVDSLWVQIRAIKELVPLAQAGERAEDGRKKAAKASAENRKREREASDAQIAEAARNIRARNPHTTFSDLARILSERHDLGGFEALRKKLPRLLRE